MMHEKKRRTKSVNFFFYISFIIIINKVNSWKVTAGMGSVPIIEQSCESERSEEESERSEIIYNQKVPNLP